MEIIGTSIKGIYRDILREQNNNIIHDSGWVSNTIVDRCRILLAGFMKNDQPKGIQYLAVGKGIKDWDTTGAPPADSSVTQLMDPNPFQIQVADLDLVYLDKNDAEVAGPTHRLQITATLGTNEPPAVAPLSSYPLREFGLFGQYFDGTNYYEYMIDCIRHPVIHKDVSATLIRVVRLYF
ncbi:MAG: hypothetical protein JRD93_08640 [Deltaproteobacteria bacterium]|nr:hypothetical protein [Deltaproteobacteria bacterium]